MVVTRAPPKVTDLRTLGCRRAHSPLRGAKNFLEGSEFFSMSKEDVVIELTHRQAKDTLASTTIRVCLLAKF